MLDGVFLSLTLITLLAVVLAFLAAHFKQPLLLGYLLAGMLLGPAFLNILPETHVLSIFSELGLALLLFIIGMEIDIRRLRSHGLKAFAIGFAQVMLTLLLSLVLLQYLLPAHAALALAIALAMSSTLVVVKTLYEMKKLESLYGQVVLGILLAQDVAAVLAIAFFQAHATLALAAFASFFSRFLILTLITILIARLVLPFAQRFFAHQTELVFITAMAFFFLFDFLAQALGLSMSIGAFLAGMLLSTTLSTAEVTGRIKPVKDFFLMLFFALLGAQLILPPPSTSLFLLTLIFLSITLLFKPLLIFILTRLAGFGPRTAFLTSVSLAQQGEFGLVILGIAYQQGMLSQDVFSLYTLLTLLLMILTVYVIRWDERLYARLARFSLFRVKEHAEKEYRTPRETLRNHYVIFGYHELTEALLEALPKRVPVLIVDHNPEKVRELRRRGVHAVLLELTNIEGYDHLNLEEARAVVSTIHHPKGNAVLAREVKKRNPRALVIVIARHASDVPLLKEAGADFVALPLHLSGKEIADLLVERLEEVEELKRVEEKVSRVERGIKIIGEREKLLEEEVKRLEGVLEKRKRTRISGEEKRREETKRSARKKTGQKRKKKA